MTMPRPTSRAGFTLIEVIATLLLSAIAFAALLPFLDRVFLQSHEPRVQLQQAMNLQSAMENLVATHTNTLENLRTRIGAAGTSAGDQVTVTENRYITFTGGLESGTPTSNNLLKVTLQNALGEQVTRIFTERP
ncbi:MAG TPA: type II secretion system protein [Kiritimatiellia bacterium]|nr:type II secretion system protein [Kiritimatiellia bacterium]HMP33746.1 type II secretion system protein [Kiritimatiellia bacterium]